MTSKLTREERIQSLYDLKIGQVLNQSDIESIKMLARIALAAMGSEPVFNLLVSQAGYKGQKQGNNFGFTTLDAARELKEGKYLLYRHAQQPVVPEEITSASAPEVFEIAAEAERMGLRGTYASYAVGWNACRAAMLQAGNSPVIPDTWIPVSERMPENKPGCYEYLVFETLNNRVNHDYWNVPDKGDDAFTPFWNYYGEHVTHWMPLPAAPQEVKGE